MGDAAMPLGALTITLHAASVGSVTPVAASTSGLTLFAVNGTGFAGASCADNVVTLGGDVCGVVSCSWTNLQVRVPGWCCIVHAVVTEWRSVFHVHEVLMR
jgi:hypothetical protein